MDYFKHFDNAQKVLESCEGSLTQKGFLHYGFKLLFYDTAGVYDRFSKRNKIMAAKAG